MGSRKPAPTSTHLLKGDPDSATSPSKYLSLFGIPGQILCPAAAGPGPGPQGLEMSDNTPRAGSSSDENYNSTTKRKKLRKRKSRRELGSRMLSNREKEEDAGVSSRPAAPTSVPALPILNQTKNSKKLASRDYFNPNKKFKEISKLNPSLQHSDKKDDKSRRKSSVTNYDLKAFLQKNKLVDKNGMRTVKTLVKTVKKMKAQDEGMLLGEIEEVEGSLTSASEIEKRPSRQSLLGQRFRDTANQIVVKSKTTDTVPQHNIVKHMLKSSEDFEAQIRAMKHIPPGHGGPRIPVPSTGRVESGVVLGLPPVLVHAGTEYRNKVPHQFVADYDAHADVQFYADFKFAYIVLPLPCDSLPRE